jgi:hypothetical protein
MEKNKNIVEFGELSQMIKNWELDKVIKVEKVYFNYYLVYDRDAREIQISNIRNKIEKLKNYIDYIKNIEGMFKVEPDKINDFIKDPSGYFNKKIYDKMKEKDPDMINIEIFKNLYGIGTPEIENYGDILGYVDIDKNFNVKEKDIEDMIKGRIDWFDEASLKRLIANLFIFHNRGYFSSNIINTTYIESTLGNYNSLLSSMKN